MYSRANPASSRSCSNRTDPAQPGVKKKTQCPPNAQTNAINRLEKEKGKTKQRSFRSSGSGGGVFLVFLWWRSLARALLSSTSRSVVDCGVRCAAHAQSHCRQSGVQSIRVVHWYQVVPQSSTKANRHRKHRQGEK